MLRWKGEGMRKSRFAESQILAVLKPGETGTPVAEIVRKHGISWNTYFIWKPKYAGATISEVRRSGSSSKRTRGSSACTPNWRWRTRPSKKCWPKVVTPSAKRQAIALLVTEHRLSVVRACQVVRLTRAVWYRAPSDRLLRDAPVIDALTTEVGRNPRWGFWKLYDRLRNLGRPWTVQGPRRETAG